MKIKRLPFLLALCAAGVLIGVLLNFVWHPKPKYVFMGREIPEGGLVVHPQGVGHPGDPENAVKAFRKIYAAMDAFRRINNRLPEPEEMMDFSKPLAPGHQLTREDFNTPDWPYSDRYLQKDRNPNYQFTYYTARPDGTPRPAFPAKGEKDIWFRCDDYTRSNQIVQRDHTKDSFFPTGVFVVLWSDGSIEKVPVQDEAHFQDPKQRNALISSIKGQAGLPKKIITAADLYAQNHLIVRARL